MKWEGWWLALALTLTLLRKRERGEGAPGGWVFGKVPPWFPAAKIGNCKLQIANWILPAGDGANGNEMGKISFWLALILAFSPGEKETSRRGNLAGKRALLGIVQKLSCAPTDKAG
jgi:hypothetical protein